MNQIEPAPGEKHESQQSALDSIRRQRPPLRAELAKRSWHVTFLKRILPGLAVLLLVALAVAPSWRSGDGNRITYHLSKDRHNEESRVEGAAYHGRDDQGQPYVATAASAVQQNDGNISLTLPQGSLILKSGSWLSIKADTGLYYQKLNKLDLDGHLMLYRNDGTIMVTSHAKIDLHTNNASGSDPVQISGPFGTLEAQNGFSLTDHGNQMMFYGPAKLVLNQAQ